MSVAAGVFWSSLALVAWAYAGYPALAALRARRRGRPPVVGNACPPLTVVIAARDEAGGIQARLHDLFAQDYPAGLLRVVVASDGSRDDTVARAAAVDPRVRVLDLCEPRGKASALNAAMAVVDTGVAVMADARQRFAPGTLRALVAPFADPGVAVVGGQLVLGDAGAVGLYWRLETRLRQDEARLGWLHGVTGAVYAVRRDRFVPIPEGTILDDMWVPLQALFRGGRVWMAPGAVAYDRAADGSGAEFSRKLRTLAGNWQLLARMPRLALPGANPVFLAWASHKLARLLVPWALLAALVASAAAPGWPYRVALVAQLAGYLAAALALWRPRLAARVPLLPACATFVMLNAAALLSLPASLAWSPAQLWRRG